MSNQTTQQGSLIGYARVSTHDQTTDGQMDALRDAGCLRIFEETASGTRTDRPELAAALDFLREGDTLVVWRLDRLGRSLKHLIETVAELDKRGIGFVSIHENIDTTTSAGRLVFHLFGALAEFERDLIVDRTKSGLAAARERGAKPGRKPVLTEDQVVVVRSMHSAGQHTISAIADVVGVSRATVYRCLDSTAA
ncbi:recombinase family protein [Nocardioides marmoriginsengisoli]|uniref:Recombinase family protein n=1 Tax=Nocardioides marmoriginsengisoli TaxID=661483 RepID=A0A3N0CN97_9ACTN|nr:recombinase family protein [Nocardioides marmoriginsengisoli]RNL64383.1 recombinase family protein [Nocardioides marmoriginsengisoli]